jgi:hypothetical protein
MNRITFMSIHLTLRLLVLTTAVFTAGTALADDTAGSITNQVAGPWKKGDALNAKDAPIVANHALVISAEIEPAGTNGVIIAQGAGGNGYALYLKDGRLAFALRSQRQLTTVVAGEPLGTGHFKVEARLAADGAIAISTDGRPVAAGHAPGLIAVQPARGLTVGLNYQAVGEYTAPNPFTGKISNATVTTQ